MRWDVKAGCRGVLGALCLALLGACPQPPPDRPLAVEVGTGEGGLFVPLTEGEPLALHQGFQGGQHVFVSVRAQGLLEPSSPTVLVTLSLERVSDGQQLGQPFSGRLTFVESPGLEDTHERTGMLLVVSDPSVVGEQARLTATVEDEDGASASDTHTGQLQWAVQ